QVTTAGSSPATTLSSPAAAPSAERRNSLQDRNPQMKVAVLDDYQRVARRLGDWTPVEALAELVVFEAPFADREQAIATLSDFDVICLMRERLPFPRAMFEALPKLKCLITTGQINRAIDNDAARDHNVVVKFTGDGPGYEGTAEL